jgi:hypothetical protein
MPLGTPCALRAGSFCAGVSAVTQSPPAWLPPRGMQRKEGGMFTGVKVFSATKAKEREELGENVTRWMKSNADLDIVDRVVTQSSDNEFHCLTVILFYRERKSV